MAFLEGILAVHPDGLIVSDEDGVIVSCSATAERLFGYPAGEVVGRDIALLMPAPVRRGGNRPVIGVGLTGTGRRKDGSTFVMELSVGEVRLGDRRLFSSFVRDVTSRQEIERRTRDARAELGQAVHPGELRHMIAVLAHELSEPVTAITCYAEASRLLLDGGDSRRLGAASASLEKLRAQAARASDVVHRLGALAGSGVGARRLEDLFDVIEGAAGLALPGADLLGIRIALRLDPRTRSATVDRPGVQLVLLNLMRNAVEAMQQSERRELVVATALASAEQIEISVIDTGPGLADGVQAELLKPFVTTKPDGKGFGLAICRQIVAANGGALRAEPNPGGGTIFRFTVPAASGVE